MISKRVLGSFTKPIALGKQGAPGSPGLGKLWFSNSVFINSCSTPTNGNGSTKKKKTSWQLTKLIQMPDDIILQSGRSAS